MNSLYLSRLCLTSFDGDEPANPPEVVFTPEIQGRVNELLASDRRKHSERIKKAENELAEERAAREQDRREREELAARLEELQAKTPDEKWNLEKKKIENDFKKQIDVEKKSREEWEGRFRQGTVERALVEASGDAISTGVLLAMLRPHTRAEREGNDFKVVVDLPDTDPNGEPVVVSHTPQSAVKHMKAMPEYQHLFKSPVVSGVAAHTAPVGGGRIDPKTLSQQQYMYLRETNPELLGLRPKKRH
jgi:hypothetical protein